VENNPRERHDIAIQIAQLQELEARLSKLQNKVDSLDLFRAEEPIPIIPPLTNFIDNSDFLYSDETYNNPAYTDDENVLALWYARPQNLNISWEENTDASSTGEAPNHSIRKTGHSSGVRANVEWDITTGSVKLSGGQVLATRLPIRHAYAGNYLVTQFQLWKNDPAAVIPENIMAKVSIWDNTDNKIIEGAKPTLQSIKVGSHSGGTITRQYILEVQMPDRRTFYSDTTTFNTGSNQVENTVNPFAVDNNNTVSISWNKIIGSSRYRIYRRIAGGDWYLIGTITNGSNQFIDSGGIGGGVWTIPTFDNERKEFQKAEAFILNIGKIVANNTDPHTVVAAIQIPTNFTPNGDQFLQIEFLKNDYSNTTTAEIPTKKLTIDKVGLSYTNGRWTPSSRDLTLAPAPTGNPSPPPSTGGGGINPPAGGGHRVDPDDIPLENPPEF
jgi:hypothetical protein